MSAMNKQYKRLAEIDEEEHAILVKLLKEIDDINLVSTEFNISPDDLENLLQEENKKEQQMAEANKREQQLAEVKKDKRPAKPLQKPVGNQEKNKNLQTQGTSTNQSRSKGKNKKIDYRMRSIRNKYYFFYRRKSNIVECVPKKKMTPEEEKELESLIALVSKGIITSKTIRKIDEKIETIDDVDKLNKLQSAFQIRRGSYDFRIDGIKSRLSMRISKLRMQNSIDTMLNSVSDNMKEIIEGIASGNIDIEDAKRKIDSETQQRLAIAQKNSGKFAMTEEQCRKQVFMQIRRILTDRVEQFPILDPVKSVSKLNELTGKDEACMNVTAVVRNLSSRNEYNVAKAVCENFSSGMPAIVSLKREVIGKEIGELVLAQIRKSATPEEDTTFVDMLEGRLNMYGVPKKLISLGTSADKLYRITLADVWYEDRVK